MTQKKYQQTIKSVLNDQQHAEMMFDSPVDGLHQQFLKLKRYYNPKTIPDNKNNSPEQNYAVTDWMTVRQLRQNWYNTNKNQLQKKGGPQKYVLMWQCQFPLYESNTMRQIKKKLQIDRFSLNSLIRVYWQWDCPYQQDQSALNYQNFEQKHLGDRIQSVIKIINLAAQQNIYFYVETNFTSTYAQLFQKINLYLKDKKNVINYNVDKKYKIYVDKEIFSKREHQAILQKFGEEKVECVQKGNKLYIPSSKIKIRDVCAPGQVLYLQFDKIDQVKWNKVQDFKYNPTIEIVYYKQEKNQGLLESSIESNQEKEKMGKNQQKNKPNSNNINMQQIVFKRKYSQIRDVKVRTILREENIVDFLVTSLSYQNKIIKPFQLFKELQPLINGKKDVIRLICIPQNFLYYREINLMQSLQYKDIMESFLAQLLKSNKIKQVQKDNYRKKRQKRIQNQQIDVQHKDFALLDPIILYTGPHIYTQLNQYLRQTSVSLFETQYLISKSWHYIFCQKLIKSLLRLNNYQGKVYRGSSNFDYNYKKNQIIEWNCFNSTSLKKQFALKFIAKKSAKKHLYLFEIHTFSGKQIHQFSYYSNQHEVLIMPYTRFRVKSIEERQQKVQHQGKIIQLSLKYVILQQLPIPKKIPGNIVVWIDANMGQNLKTFNKIVKQNKQKLNNFDLIQIPSNQMFIKWLNQYKNVLLLHDVNIHFISNMNRPPSYQNQGVQTLKIIRSFRPKATIAYYISNVDKTKQALQKHGVHKDQNIQIASSVKGLQRIFLQRFIKN